MQAQQAPARQTSVPSYPLDLRALDLRALVAEVWPTVTRSGAGPGVGLWIDNLPMALGDRQFVARALAILLGEAVKVAQGWPDGLVEVGTRIRQGGEVAYYVRAGGVSTDRAPTGGVSADRAPVDGRGGQGVRTENPAATGDAGPGLDEVTQIVTRHGGRLWVEAESGAAVTVAFTLPAATAVVPRPSPVRD